MCRIAALVAVLALATIAHADTIGTYTGTVIVNGEDDIHYPDTGAYIPDGVLHRYNNEAVAASLTIYGLATSVPGLFYNVDGFFIDLPVLLAPSDFPTFSPICFELSCVEVDYLSPGFPDGRDPLPTVSVSGSQNYYEPQPDGSYLYGNETYAGTLTLVAATPEASTFILFGTGLLAVAGIASRRSPRSKTSLV